MMLTLLSRFSIDFLTAFSVYLNSSLRSLIMLIVGFSPQDCTPWWPGKKSGPRTPTAHRLCSPKWVAVPQNCVPWGLCGSSCCQQALVSQAGRSAIELPLYTQVNPRLQALLFCWCQLASLPIEHWGPEFTTVLTAREPSLPHQRARMWDSPLSGGKI
jgi:hypothetical protein